MSNRATWNGGLAVVLLFAFGMYAFADEPKDLNSDFESGLGKWRGEGRRKADEKGN